MSTFFFEVHLSLIDSSDIFHDVGSSGRPNREPSDAADNEDTSDLSKCHKELRVVFCAQRAAAEALRAEQETETVEACSGADTTVTHYKLNFQEMKRLVRISITTAVLIRGVVSRGIICEGVKMRKSICITFPFKGVVTFLTSLDSSLCFPVTAPEPKMTSDP